MKKIAEYDEKEKKSEETIEKLLSTIDELKIGYEDLAKKVAQDDTTAKMLANAEHTKKQNRAAKVIILQKQILRKADDLKHEMINLKLVTEMKELEVREALHDSNDWIKRLNEIQTMMDETE